jgi:hypothetical protein
MVVLTTKHEKLELIAPALVNELGLDVLLHEADTDLLGTFSGEIPRTLTGKQAAIEKAKIGALALGKSIGIASEGSIGPDPILPFARSDIEYLALVDLELGLEVVESFRSLEIVAGELTAEPGTDLVQFLTQVDFPSHKLIVRPNKEKHLNVVKGIGDMDSLILAIQENAALSVDGKVMIQSDLRAHCSPSRQANIRKVAERLAQRLKSLCANCESPGWGSIDYERGLNCSECGEFVAKALKFEVFGCGGCSLRERGPIISEFADPGICDSCNP